MKRLLFVFLLFFSVSSFAVDYSWRAAPNSSFPSSFTNTSFSSARSVCDAIPGAYVNGSWSATGVVVSFTLTNSSTGQYGCVIQIKNSSGTSANSGVFAIYRYGDSCPSGATYDSVTGECKSDNPCANKPPMPFSKSGTAGDGYMTLIPIPGSAPKSAAATEGCFGGCLASTTDQKCIPRTSGSYYCRGTAYFSGQSCATNTPGLAESSSTPLPDPQTLTEDKPCNYTTNANGTQSCTSTKSVEQEGQVCGTVSATGEKICVDKQPTKNGVDIATNVSTKTNADGTKETTKTDSATTTKCSGIQFCTSSTTTVSTTVKTDANGKTTAATGTCSGANCPDKNTNPDGNGDGFGDCVSGDCGDGEGGGPNTPKLDDVDSYQVTTQKFYDKIKSSPVAASVNAISVPENGAAPNFRTDSIAALGGVSLDFGIVGQLWSSVADVLSAVMKAVWCFVAVVIFLMA